MKRSYLELITLPTFEERFNYLKLCGRPSEVTFGRNRNLNQMLYHSPQWKAIRQEVIIRDNGCDLAMQDRPIMKDILIHHLNPITIEQVVNHDPIVFDTNNLVCVSFDTHNAIHYSDGSKLIPSVPLERKLGDTCLW